MSRGVTADILVSWTDHMTACVTDRCRDDARHLAEDVFRAPETATAKTGQLVMAAWLQASRTGLHDKSRICSNNRSWRIACARRGRNCAANCAKQSPNTKHREN